MTRPDPFEDTLGRTARPLRTALIAALLAFVVGAIVMGWALMRWGPARDWIASDGVGASSAPAPQVVAALPRSATIETGAAAPALAAPVATEVEARVSELEARIARADLRAAAAAGNAGRAEGMLIAFAARRAIDRGTGLGYIEGQLRDRFAAAQPRAVAQIIAAAQRPVTLVMLRQQLDTIAPQLLTGGRDEDWWTATRRTLGSLIVVRRESGGSPAPDQRIGRARLMIDGGQVDGALAEISRLPGAASANSWGIDARRWIEAHQALDILEAAAIMPPPPGSIPAAAAN